MSEGHARFEGLAVEHVLGSLDVDDAAHFRAHLVGCRECRLRVAELRDIAAGLEATERDERRRAGTTTQLVRREAALAVTRSTTARRGRVVPVALATLVAVVAATSFWNYHLRRQNTVTATAVAKQARALDALTTGEDVAVETTDGVEAVAAIHDGRLFVSATGIPAPDDTRSIVVWEVVDDEARPAGDAEVFGDRLLLDMAVAGIDGVIVTQEAAGETPEVAGHELLAVNLPG